MEADTCRQEEAYVTSRTEEVSSPGVYDHLVRERVEIVCGGGLLAAVPAVSQRVA